MHSQRTVFRGRKYLANQRKSLQQTISLRDAERLLLSSDSSVIHVGRRAINAGNYSEGCRRQKAFWEEPHPPADLLVGLAELAQALRPLDVVARYEQGRPRCRRPRSATCGCMRGTLRGLPVILLRLASWRSGLSRLRGTRSWLTRCSNCSRVYRSPCADKNQGRLAHLSDIRYKLVEYDIQGKAISAKHDRIQRSCRPG